MIRRVCKYENQIIFSFLLEKSQPIFEYINTGINQFAYWTPIDIWNIRDCRH